MFGRIKLYTVMAPPSNYDGDREVAIQFIPQSFSWFAFLVPVIWLLVKRMWLVLLAYLVATVVLQLIAAFLNPIFGLIVFIAFSFFFALEARHFLIWTLHRKGWEEIGVTSGKRQDEAERRFFEKWVEAKPQTTFAPKSPLANYKKAVQSNDIVGLFPAK
jgi:hypothetical protein